MMDTDHRTICKFDSHTVVFPTVHAELKKVLDELKQGRGDCYTQYDRLPGHPRFIAQAYPPNKQQHWWEGNGLNEFNIRAASLTHCIGRSADLRLLESFLTVGPRPRLTVVKGIGGIGYLSPT
jgi:hypothetical protein